MGGYGRKKSDFVARSLFAAAATNPNTAAKISCIELKLHPIESIGATRKDERTTRKGSRTTMNNEVQIGSTDVGDLQRMHNNPQRHEKSTCLFVLDKFEMEWVPETIERERSTWHQSRVTAGIPNS